MVADPRFAGGTSAALIADTQAFLAIGANVGLVFVTSGFLSEADPLNKSVQQLLDHDRVRLVPSSGEVSAETAFLHHPMVFFHGIAERMKIRADRAVLVTHHAPFRGDGSLEYDPIMTTWRAWRALGIRPAWAPISGLCRAQLASFSPLIKLTDENWVNIFDPAEWQPKRKIFSDPDLVVIGRHGRSDTLKWPETTEKIAESLPSGDGRKIRVMGCPERDLTEMGVDMAGWDLLSFNEEPVDHFLDSLDIFSFFHHPLWIETFGRTVAEAILMGRACILDPSLKPTFGDLAHYCETSEVNEAVEKIAGQPDTYREISNRNRDRAIELYSSRSVAGRYNSLSNKHRKATATLPTYGNAHTIRKLLGLYKRRMKRPQV